MKAEYTNYDPEAAIPDELRGFLELTTPVITDAMGRLGAMYGTHCLLPGKAMIGYAKTVRILHGDWLWVCKAIDEMEPGQVLVVDMGGTESVSIHGDLSNAGLINAKACGIIVDGGIRDVQDLRIMGMPCYYRHISPNAGNPHEDGGVTGITVVAFGQAVRDGDVIVGDDNGVVVIPQDTWQEVLEASHAQEAYEQQTAQKIFDGGPMLSYDQ